MYYRVLVIDAVPVLGREWFYEHRYWRHVKPGDDRLRGEINAGLTFSHCAHKIARDMPSDVKLLFMMREPVARAFSAYKYFTCPSGWSITISHMVTRGLSIVTCIGCSTIPSAEAM